MLVATLFVTALLVSTLFVSTLLVTVLLVSSILFCFVRLFAFFRLSLFHLLDQAIQSFGVVRFVGSFCSFAGAAAGFFVACLVWVVARFAGFTGLVTRLTFRAAFAARFADLFRLTTTRRRLVRVT